MFNEALNNAIGYLAQCIAIVWAYWLTSMLLKTFWIEGKPYAYTVTGKILSALFCAIGWTLIAAAIYFMMKEIKSAYVVFIIGIAVSGFAIYRAYSNKELKDKLS